MQIQIQYYIFLEITMKIILKFLALNLCIATLNAAPPSVLITTNNTDVKSNAYIDGTIPSLYPTNAKSNRSVSWIAVSLACQGHIKDNLCKALVKMDIDSVNPIELGEVTLNMKTGEILPTKIINNGYQLEVIGLGKIELSQITQP
jgi:hypothetical protein